MTTKPATAPKVDLNRRDFLASTAAVGGTMPAVYNAANEACVADFLAGRISSTYWSLS